MSEEPGFTPDRTWNAWKINSFDDYYAGLPVFKFKESVADDVVTKFALIEKLLKYSYYEYDFLDVAMRETSLGFELALRIRYEEIEQKGSADQISLHDLILWGGKQALFEDETEVLLNLKELRNFLAHPKDYSQFGITALSWIQRVADGINGLYEDPIGRKKRRRFEKKFNKFLSLLADAGAELYIEDKVVPVFIPRLLYYDNVASPNVYHWLFWPVIDLEWKDGQLEEGSPILLQTDNYSEEGGEFIFQGLNPEKVISFRKIEGHDKILSHEKWRIALESEKIVENIIRFKISEYRYEIIRGAQQQ